METEINAGDFHFKFLSLERQRAEELKILLLTNNMLQHEEQF